MPKTVSQLVAEIDAQLPTNNSGQVTAAALRAVLDDIVNNFQVSVSQINTTSGVASSTTALYGDGTWKTISSGGAAPAGVDGDIQIKAGSLLAALDRTGGSSTDYLARDNTYKSIGGGGTIVASGNPVFNTYADAHAAVTGGTVDPSVKAFWTAGYYIPGDKGSSFYVDVGSTDPTLSTSEPLVHMPVGEPAILHDTTNNRFFMMTDKAGAVWVEQFGARKEPDWLMTTYDTLPYCYAAQRYVLQSQRNGRGCNKIRIGSGSWYFSAPFNMKGGTVWFEGSGYSTWLHNPSDQPAIVFCPPWGFGAAGLNGWQTSMFCALGLQVGRGLTSPAGAGNVYECIVSGVTAASGNGVTGTGSNITDGTVTWKYLRPMIPEEYNNDNPGAFAVENLNVYSLWDFVSLSTPAQPFGKNVGIQGRSRGLIRGVFGANQSGHGLVFLANGDSSFPNSTGNVNGWKMENVSAYWNGWSGIRVGYSDGNAGHAIGVDVSANGWFGVDDNTFLQATWIDIQCAYDGSRAAGAIKEHPGGVTYNGRWYYARVEQTGLESSPLDYTTLAPDVSPNWILYYGTNSGDAIATPSTDFPTWSNTGKYEPGGGVCGRDVNSGSTWVSVYIEGGTGPSQIGVNHVGIGGLVNDSLLPPVRGQFLVKGVFSNTVVASYGKRHPTRGGLVFEASLGSQFGQCTPLQWSDWDGNVMWLAGRSADNISNLDYEFSIDGVGRMARFTGKNSLKTFGRSAGVPAVFQPINFAFGTDDTTARIWDMGTAAPTSGYHAKGERVYNSDHDGTNTNYWICSASGTPGTWVAKT